MTRWIAKPGWVYVGPASGDIYGVGKGYTFAAAAERAALLFPGGTHLRLATSEELARIQDFHDRCAATRGIS